MGKILETKIDKFGSMTPNLRENSYDFAFSSHFNIFRKGKLSPNLAYTTFTDGSEKVFKFLYARGLEGAAISYYIYGLGDDGSGHPKIFRMGPGYELTPDWTVIATAVGTLAKVTNVFFEYKDCLYGWQGNTPTSDGEIWTIPNLEGDTTPNLAQYKVINFTNVAQPIHHKADDYAYFFYDNKVCRHTGATDSTVWSADVLTLPTNMKIIGGAAYGNYLAIVCSPLELGATNSVMYLWDRDSSLATLTSKIDLGMGEAIHVSEAEDGGIWITQKTTGITGTTCKNNSISVKYYNGFLETLEVPVGMPTDYFSSVSLTGNSWEERNIFYFPATIVTMGAAETRNVIFAARRRGGRIELIADQEITGVTQNINGIFSVGGIWLVSYNTAAQSLIAKVSSLFQTGTYESKIFDAGDASLKKKLIGVTVMTSPMPINSTVSFYYRKDEETAWTLIFTQTATAAGSVSHSAINIESSGANLPEYKEIQLKLTSTGGAEITAFSFMEEILGKRLYMALFEAIMRWGASLFTK